jgi:hypothetical protein
VDRVERGYLRQRQEEKRADEQRELVARANVPEMAFEIPLQDFEVSDRLYAVISETGYQTVGDLMLQMKLDADKIWRLNGMGPNAMAELEQALAKIEAEAAAQAEAKAAEEEEALAETPPSEEVEAVEGEAPAVEEREAEEVEAEAVGEVEALVVEESPQLAEEVAEGKEEEPMPVEGEAEEIPVSEAVELEEEEPTSLDEIFTLRPEVLDFEIIGEDEEEEDDEDRKRKKKKKKKRYIEIEYDPEQDVVLAKKKRKRSDQEGWEDEW